VLAHGHDWPDAVGKKKPPSQLREVFEFLKGNRGDPLEKQF